MAEIHVMPAPIDPDAATRLLAVLSGAMTDGIDLGPRRLHICALALSLETLVTTLRLGVEGPRSLPGSQEPGLQEAQAAVHDFIAHVETLISRAREYPL